MIFAMILFACILSMPACYSLKEYKVFNVSETRRVIPNGIWYYFVICVLSQYNDIHACIHVQNKC